MTFQRRNAPDVRLFNMYYFTHADADPRFAGSVLVDPEAPFEPTLQIVDTNPATQGVGYYTLLATRSRTSDEVLKEAGLTDGAVWPWWGAPLTWTPQPPTGTGVRSSYVAFWRSMYSDIYTSDYSAPFTYSADILPELGSIDALAVDNTSGSYADIFASNTATKQIFRMKNKGSVMQEAEVWANVGFANPGQKGLAFDPWNKSLVTDNAASDSQFGGRLFRFTPLCGGSSLSVKYTGYCSSLHVVRELTGTVNYFSQVLMFAHPLLAGPMAFDGWRELLVYDAMPREIKRVPVNHLYDPARRVGKVYYRFPEDEDSRVIDIETRNIGGMPEIVYMLTGSEIVGVPSIPSSSGQFVAGPVLERVPLE